MINCKRPAFILAQDTEDRFPLFDVIPVDTRKVIEVPLEVGVLSVPSRKVESGPALPVVQVSEWKC